MPYKPPSKKIVQQIIKPFYNWFEPHFIEEEKDLSSPALFVSNHTIYGLTDGFLFGAHLYLKHDKFLRALGDNQHFNIPVWSNLVQQFGMLKGSREACKSLMDERESILVFPGGAGEIAKRKGEAYQLKWKERTGFVRMAMEYGYDIIPVAAYGGEETFDIKYDAADFLGSQLGKQLINIPIVNQWLKGGENLIPFATGIGISPIPKPEKIYIQFGGRISTKDHQKHFDSKQKQLEIRELVMQKMNLMFKNLRQIKESEPNKTLWRSLLGAI